MNLKTRPLLLAAGLGGLLQLVISVVGQALSIFLLPQYLSEIQSLDNGLAPIIMAVGVGNCLCSAMLDMLTGATYSWLYPREAPLTPGDGILGGGAAAALARLGSGAMGLFISLLFLPLVSSQLKLPSDVMGPMLALGMVQGVICGIVGLVVAAIISALFGFVGGGIVAVIREQQSGQLSGAGLL